MSPKSLNNFFKSRLGKISIASLAVILISGIGITYSLVNRQSRTAQAASVVSLAPGQTGLFTIQYINAGDSDSIANALTTIFINNKLIYVPGSLTEQFGGPTQPVYCINDNASAGIVTVASDGSTNVSYRPRSSTTLTSPCNGQSTAGPATLTAAPEATPSDPSTWAINKTGSITFRATLSSTAGLTAGSTVTFAIIAETTLDGASGGAASLNIGVIATSATTITPSNTGNGTCTPTTITIPATYSCTFPLTGGTDNNYILPSGGIAGTTSQNGNTSTDITPVSGGYGSSCTITGNGTTTAALSCTVPTTGGTPGDRNVLLQYGGTGSPTPSGTLTLTPPIVPVRSGRLYCIGLDNAPVSFDEVTRENTNCNITQKFKDGTMTIVYDQLKDSTGNLLTTGTCTFEFIRYPKPYIPANILRSYTSNITNGACQTTLAAIDQTLNYYDVIATATSGNTVLRDSYNLNLYVGG